MIKMVRRVSRDHIIINDLQRKIESNETVMRRWHICGIDAGAPSTQKRRY